MYVISIAAEKGGVGKTASTVNLAYGLKGEGYEVGIIDLDGQGHATAYLGEERGGQKLHDTLLSLSEPLNWVDTAWGIKLVPGGQALNALPAILPGQRGSEVRLKHALSRTQDNPEVVLIDCPPGFGIRVVNALVASTGLLVPVTCDDSGVDGLVNALDSLEEVRTLLGSSCHLLGVLPQMVDTRTNMAAENLDWLKSQFGEEFVSPKIRRAVAVGESWGAKTPILEYEPSGAGAKDYKKATTWLQQRIG